MKKRTKKPVYKIVDEIVEAWEIATSIKDDELLDDIKSAIEEAYRLGAERRTENEQE